MATSTPARRSRPSARVAAAGVLASVFPLVLSPLAAGASPAWWEPLAFAGERVSAVAIVGGGLYVAVNGAGYLSTDGGITFHPSPATQSSVTAVRSGTTVWEISGGTVLTGKSSASLRPDPGAPFLGATARLLAAPAGAPGVVAAVGTDGHVWRRGQDGRWATALVLLPEGGISGVPAVTGIAAFSRRPISTVLYLGTDGYGVLLSSNGGDDWIRAGAGLPASVLGLVTDPSSPSLYAATGNGLWIHRLQAFPAPPVYHDAALYLRWLGIAAVGVVATVIAVIALHLALRRPHAAEPGG